MTGSLAQGGSRYRGRQRTAGGVRPLGIGPSDCSVAPQDASIHRRPDQAGLLVNGLVTPQAPAAIRRLGSCDHFGLGLDHRIATHPYAVPTAVLLPRPDTSHSAPATRFATSDDLTELSALRMSPVKPTGEVVAPTRTASPVGCAAGLLLPAVPSDEGTAGLLSVIGEPVVASGVGRTFGRQRHPHRGVLHRFIQSAGCRRCGLAGERLRSIFSGPSFGVTVCEALERPATVDGRLRVGPAVLGLLSRVRATIAYLGVLCLVDLVLDTAPGAAHAAVVLGSSTNLANLVHGRLGTLAASAFVYEGGFVTRQWLVLAALLAAAEWSWGFRRLVGVFAIGHVGATLIVAAGLGVGIGMGLLPQSLAHSPDVGASYGMMAVGAALVVQLPHWLRPVWATCWLADAGAAWLSGRDFADAGHLIAFLIGLGIAAAWTARSREHRSSVVASLRHTVRSVVAGAISSQATTVSSNAYCPGSESLAVGGTTHPLLVRSALGDRPTHRQQSTERSLVGSAD